MPEYPIQQLLEDINQALSPEEFDRAAGSALAAFDELNGQQIRQRKVNLACREGCSVCHTQMIRTLRAEIERYGGQYSRAGGIVFPNTGVGRQLRQVARAIMGRAGLGAVRQTFFDTQHYALDVADYAQNQSGRKRPAFNPALRQTMPCVGTIFWRFHPISECARLRLSE